MKNIFKLDVFHDGFLVMLIFSAGIIIGLVFGLKINESEVKKAEKKAEQCIEINEKMIEFQRTQNDFTNKLIEIIRYRKCIN